MMLTSEYDKEAYKKSGKKEMKENEFRLETRQRPDVVLKTILRSIRRYFITIFNNTTNYNKCKRGKGPDYYWEQL